MYAFSMFRKYSVHTHISGNLTKLIPLNVCSKAMPSQVAQRMHLMTTNAAFVRPGCHSKTIKLSSSCANRFLSNRVSGHGQVNRIALDLTKQMLMMVQVLSPLS